jgi:hypothetical protein
MGTTSREDYGFPKFTIDTAASEIKLLRFQLKALDAYVTNLRNDYRDLVERIGILEKLVADLHD